MNYKKVKTDFIKFQKVQSKAGFTLIETLIALVILGVALAILVEGFLSITTTMDRQKDYNYLMARTEEKMIEVVNGIELATHGNFEYQGREYHWIIEEEVLEAGLKKIVLNVQWQGRNSEMNYSINRTIIESSYY